MAINIDTNQKEYTYTLTPFMRCVLQNFPFIEEDFDALTNYGLLCKVVEYLNKVIANQNTVQDNVTELNTAFTELKTYVDDYIGIYLKDDVDEKLDEMAEDGTLENIIEKYINNTMLRVYTTVDELKASVLQNGYRAKTLGYYELNDGGGAEYYITDTIPETGYAEILNNGNYALLITNNEPLNIKQMGARADDSTFDNTSRIVNAINNFNSILFPNGEYYIDTRIEITGKNNLTIIGEDKSTIVYPHTSTTQVTSTQGVLCFSNSSNITIKNLKLSCGGDYMYRPYLWESSWSSEYYPKRYAAFNGLVISNSTDIFIDNMEIYNSQVGIYFTFVERAKITNSLIRDNLADSYRIGCGCKYVRVENCSCYNCEDDCYVATNEHGDYASTEYEPYMVNFYNCTAHDCFGALLCIQSANDCHAYNCEAVENRDFPIKLGQSTLKLSSYNCSIENCTVITSKQVEGDTIDTSENNKTGGRVEIGTPGNGTNYNMLVRDCYFEQSNGDNKIFQFKTHAGYTLENCKFNGYALTFISNANNITLKGCQFIGHDGTALNGCNNITIKDSSFTNDTTYSTITKRAFAVINATDVLLDNVQAEGTTTSQAFSFYYGEKIESPNFTFYVTDLAGKQHDIAITNYWNLDSTHTLECETTLPAYQYFKLGQLATLNGVLYIKTDTKWATVTTS